MAGWSLSWAVDATTLPSSAWITLVSASQARLLCKPELAVICWFSQPQGCFLAWMCLGSSRWSWSQWWIKFWLFSSVNITIYVHTYRNVDVTSYERHHEIYFFVNSKILDLIQSNTEHCTQWSLQVQHWVTLNLGFSESLFTTPWCDLPTHCTPSYRQVEGQGAFFNLGRGRQPSHMCCTMIRIPGVNICPKLSDALNCKSSKLSVKNVNHIPKSIIHNFMGPNSECDYKTCSLLNIFRTIY